MPAEPLIAWVDAVGAVLLHPGERLTLGGPPNGEAADLPLTAPVRPVAGAVVRAGEGWVVEEDDAARPAGDGGAFSLAGGAVRGTVNVPNPLSAAAVVTLDAAHRPAPGWGPVRLEYAVVAAGPVVVGPDTACHVRVRGATGTVLLRPGPDGWAVRGADPVPGDDAASEQNPREEPAAPGGAAAALGWRPVAAGDVLGGGGVSLRLEAPSAG